MPLLSKLVCKVNVIPTTIASFFPPETKEVDFKVHVEEETKKNSQENTNEKG